MNLKKFVAQTTLIWKSFNGKKILTNERPIQINKKLLKYYIKKVKLMNYSKSALWALVNHPGCVPSFYAWNQAEIERSALRYVINYKPFNKVLQYIRYPIHNKRDLIKRL